MWNRKKRKINGRSGERKGKEGGDTGEEARISVH